MLVFTCLLSKVEEICLFSKNMKRHEASPDGVSSSSDDEGPRVRRSKGAAAVPQSPAKDQQLTELLAKAAESIRAERATSKSLRDEIEMLKSTGKGAPAVALRQKIFDLALENHVAVEQIATLRLKVVELEAKVTAQAKEIDDLKQASAKRYAAPLARNASPERRPASSQPVVQARSASAPRMSDRVPPPVHHFDAVASIQRTHTSGALNVNDLSSGSVNGLAEQAVAGQHLSQKNYNDMMITRLRRAIAPPPTKEQMGEVVHAMVRELKKQLWNHGADLPMKRLDHCVYQCGRRKLHLTVDSGRLVVKSGGGHVDLLEHIERNKLCVKRNSDVK